MRPVSLLPKHKASRSLPFVDPCQHDISTCRRALIDALCSP